MPISIGTAAGSDRRRRVLAAWAAAASIAVLASELPAQGAPPLPLQVARPTCVGCVGTRIVWTTSIAGPHEEPLPSVALDSASGVLFVARVGQSPFRLPWRHTLPVRLPLPPSRTRSLLSLAGSDRLIVLSPGESRVYRLRLGTEQSIDTTSLALWPYSVTIDSNGSLVLGGLDPTPAGIGYALQWLGESGIVDGRADLVQGVVRSSRTGALDRALAPSSLGGVWAGSRLAGTVGRWTSRGPVGPLWALVGAGLDWEGGLAQLLSLTEDSAGRLWVAVRIDAGVGFHTRLLVVDTATRSLIGAATVPALLTQFLPDGRMAGYLVDSESWRLAIWEVNFNQRGEAR